MTETESGETAAEIEASKRRGLAKAAIAGCATVLVGAALGAGICFAALSGDAGDGPAELTAPLAADVDLGEARTPFDGESGGHEHSWVAVYGLEHHDAVTHEVPHAAEYAYETSYHTVCNDCRQVIDGKAGEHIEATGHGGYSTNVPVVSEVIASQAWTETVTDVEAHDELVVTAERCSVCDALRAAEDSEPQP